MIKSLVISGGSIGGFAYIGALKQLEERGFYNRENIESIYATSIGSFVAVVFALDYDWETIARFIIKRPWNMIFPVNIETMFKALTTGGIFDRSAILKTFDPLLQGKHISPNITLAEFYERTQKHLYFITTNVRTYEICKVSHHTHPEWTLIDAVFASSALPILFPPVFVDNEMYFDGAALLNYPLSICLEDGHVAEEILGVYHAKELEPRMERLESKYKLIEYLTLLITQLWNKTVDKRHPVIPYEVPISFQNGFSEIIRTLQSKEDREILVRNGEKTAEECWKRFTK